MKTLREILRDGCLNGKERDIKRKVRKGLVKLKVWPQLAKNKPRMYIPQVQVQVVNRSRDRLIKKENDCKLKPEFT